MGDFAPPALAQSVRDLELPGDGLRATAGTAALGSVEELKGREGCRAELLARDQEWFDGVYAILRHWDEFEEDVERGDALAFLANLPGLVVEELRSGATDHDTLRCALKAATYFLAKLCVDCEKRFAESKAAAATGKKARGKGKTKQSDKRGFDWDSAREKALRSLVAVLQKPEGEEGEGDFASLWNCSLPEEAFLDLFWRVSETIVLENPKVVSSSPTIKNVLQDLICIPVHRFHGSISHVVSASFAHSLSEHEAMPKFIVSVLKHLSQEYNDERLPCELVLEVGRIETHTASKDTSTSKNLGGFVELLAREMPALALSNLSVLIPHLNAHSYTLRCSVLRALGQLVLHLKQAKTDDESIRNKLLDLIGERVHDTSSYVRAAALSVFSTLQESASLPISHVHIATDAATERLLDKSSLVRKQGIACLTTLLETNPYSERLDPEHFRGKISELQLRLESSLEEDGTSDMEKSPENASDDAYIAEVSDPANSDQQQEGEEEEEEESNQEVLAQLQYHKSALGFVARISHACTEVQQLVASKTVSDASESLRFLCVAMKFKLPAAVDSIKKVLVLVWDDRESGKVKKELLEIFELIYISEPVQVGRSTKRKLYAEEKIVEGLVQLVLGSSLAELTSLERIMCELVSTSSKSALGRLALPGAIIEKLWDRACVDLANSPRTATAALCLVAMTSSSSRSIFEKHPQRVKNLVQEMIISSGNMQAARYAFSILGMLPKKMAIEGAEEAIQAVLLAENVDETNKPHWYAAVHEGLTILIRIDDRADKTCSRLVRKMHKRVFGKSGEEERLDVLQEQLARMFFLIGHVATHLLAFSERVASLAKKARKGKKEKVSRNKAEEEELAMLGAGTDSTDDYEQILLKRIAEEELVGKDGLLGRYISMIEKVLKAALDDETTVTQELVESTVLTLCKFMCVSESLCGRYLQIIFTVLRDSPNPNVRSNIMIALGDLAVRFPNTIEPYTAQIYRRLRDPHVGVRKTSLMVLTHLILNDMIKVRGEVCEIALCLEDSESDRIQDLTKLFFTELSRKGTNPVYNLLPDTINKLSREPGLPNEKFDKIARYLMQFITLEKHVVSISDKFCQRIFAATGLTARAEEVESLQDLPGLKLCRDLSLCLSQLKFSEKGIKKLSDPLFKFYRPVLADEVVFGNFQSILKRCRQQAKSETKKLVDEWENRIAEVREGQISNHATTDKARGRKKSKCSRRKPLQQSEQIPGTSKPNTRPRRRTATTKKKVLVEEDEDEDEDDEDEEVDASESENCDSNEFEVEKTVATRRTRRSTRRTTAV